MLSEMIMMSMMMICSRWTRCCRGSMNSGGVNNSVDDDEDAEKYDTLWNDDAYWWCLWWWSLGKAVLSAQSVYVEQGAGRDQWCLVA